MFDVPTIQDEDIKRLRQTARGTKTLESLVSDITFLDVFNTPIGKELLKDLLLQHDELLTIICDPEQEATIGQKAEYKIIRVIIKKWASRINNYLKSVSEIQNK